MHIVEFRMLPILQCPICYITSLSEYMLSLFYLLFSFEQSKHGAAVAPTINKKYITMQVCITPKF